MLTLIALASVLLPQGQAWPHYRGPARTGAVATRDWSPRGRAEPLWARNVGKGYACPSIADGKLVTTGYDEKAGADRIVCLDPKTGGELWKVGFAATDKPKYHGGGTLTTPAIRAGRVYWLSRAGVLRVLDLAAGEVLWSRDYAKELGLKATYHGFSASPLLEGDRVFLQLGGTVAAVAAKDGALIWRTKDRGDLSYSNLCRVTCAGQPALASVIGPTVAVLGCDDGRILCEHPWRLKGNAVHCAVPIAVGADRVFVSTAYDKGCAMLRFGGEEGFEEVWANRYMRNKVTACVQHEGHLYGFDESMLRCLDLDGNSKWRVRGLGLGSLAIAGGRLLVVNADGELIVAEASPHEFRELSRQKVLDGGVYWTMPVLVDGLIYVRNSLGDLRCLDHRVTAAGPAVGAVPAGAPVPAPQALFARHAELVGGAAFARADGALQLRGTWDVPLRGLKGAAMTWTLVGPDRWDLRVDSRSLLYTFDGTRAWAIEPQGPRMVVGEELLEARMLFPLPGLFAPPCPAGAVTAPRPARFAETECFKVTAPAAPAGAQPAKPPGTVVYYFDAKSGRLVGSEGTGRSTLVLHGSQRLAGLTLPERITRYRAEDGQEHVLSLTSAAWIDVPPDLFALPAEIVRILRTPAEIARSTAALRARFAGALGRYKAADKRTPLEDDVIQLRVRDGELWFVTPEPSFRVKVEAEADGMFPIDGIPVRFSIDAGKDGSSTALVLELGSSRGEEKRTIRLSRLKD